MPRGPKGQKRPADVIGNAVRVMRIATGEAEEDFGKALRKNASACPTCPALGRDSGTAGGAAGGAAMKERRDRTIVSSNDYDERVHDHMAAARRLGAAIDRVWGGVRSERQSLQAAWMLEDVTGSGPVTTRPRQGGAWRCSRMPTRRSGSPTAG
jgi:hypothetical protein